MSIAVQTPDIMTFETTGALTKVHVVKRTTTVAGQPKCAEASDGGDFIGVAMNDYDSGSKEAAIAVGKITKALVDGTTDVAAGDPLKAAGGVLVKATSGNLFCATANEPQTANAEVEIEITLQGRSYVT